MCFLPGDELLARAVEAVQGVVVVGHIEMVVVWNHQAPGKGVEPEGGVFKVKFRRIERAGRIAPIAIADHVLVAIDQFLASHCCHQRELPRVAELQVGLLQVCPVRIGRRIAHVALFEAATAFDIRLEPGRWGVSQMDAQALCQFVVAVDLPIGDEIIVGIGSGAVLGFVAHPQFAADVPRVECV